MKPSKVAEELAARTEVETSSPYPGVASFLLGPDEVIRGDDSDDSPEEELQPSPRRRGRPRTRASHTKWETEAGVYKNWRPPNWGAINSRRI